MFRFFIWALFLIVLGIFTSCMPNTYNSKPRPIGISNRKAKQIQARSKIRRETIVRFDNRIVKWDFIREVQQRGKKPMESKRYSVNNNNKNRKNNYRAVARKNKRDNNYRYYRDSLEDNQKAEKSNFSIYDK